jgi:hypothetical protein
VIVRSGGVSPFEDDENDIFYFLVPASFGIIKALFC